MLNGFEGLVDVKLIPLSSSTRTNTTIKSIGFEDVIFIYILEESIWIQYVTMLLLMS